MSESQTPSSLSRGLRRWLLCPVVAGDSPSRAWGGGILWLNWQRRGDFQELVRQAGAEPPIGFRHVSGETLPQHQRFLSAFFTTPWLSFDAFVVEPDGPDADVNLDVFSQKQRRALEDFIHEQVAERLHAEPDEPQPLRLWLDAKACGYDSARAGVAAVEDHVLRALFSRLRPVDKALNHRTVRTPGLQLADLLLGAVVTAWQQSQVGAAKRTVMGDMAQALGWADLRTVSRPGDTKFNIKLGGPKQRARRPTQLPLFEPLRSSRRPSAAD